VAENSISYKTIDEYILMYPENIRSILNELRNVIKNSAPDAVEKISWQMPTFVLHGNLVHFAVHKNHIGFYPAPSGIEAFSDELKNYKTSKGAIQFPLDKPMPFELIGRIVKYRAAENLRWAEEKKKS
jgi:uncharacterized protein YdhG (YjbR/CyaY superfamily)